MPTNLIDGDKRKPVEWLNYRGDVDVDPQRGLGPKHPISTNEMLWPVTCDYDAEADRTRVGLSYLPPAAAHR